ncbi:MAG TPA: ABC transporter permease [Candidatus Binataceae bacterium]|nr:ABC transporter permease [Candidatus Binataceae bacterium]
MNREIDEELASHIEEAVEQGRDPAEARRAFGSPLRQREESRDVKLIAWLDSLRADTVFGWRQLKKKKVTSTAAILSLALAIGACTSAFRLIDALLLRPLPIAHPERLYAMLTQGIGPGGDFRITDSNEYPQFQQMRAAVKSQAELIAVSWTDRTDLTYGSDQEMEKAYVQYVSGWMFGSFGLKAARGRLFTENDDRTPHAHPVAILSYDYWTRRFGRDPKVIGHNFRIGNDLLQIVGVAPEGFTGTEPGIFTDIFLPTMMHAGVTHDDWSWIRTFVLLKPGAPPEPVRDKLQAVFNAIQGERVKSFTAWPKQRLANFLKQRILVDPAAAGLSGMQRDYLRALATLAVLVALVLLIACANVANLMTAQAAARAREMALRVSVGAGRRRLVQLVLMESAMLAFFAAAIGALFAWWSAPFVVGLINPADNPARLTLPADWRVLGFGIALTLFVTLLFGLAPALHASAVKPASALKGGEDPRSRRRLMHVLVAAQVAFCFLVLFVAGLFIATFDRLSNQPTGFSSERLLAVDTVARPFQPTVFWYHAAEYLRRQPGIEAVAIAAWPLLSGIGQNGFVSVNGAPPHALLAYFLPVSPGWLDTMRIPLLDGRDFRPEDTHPGVAIVNEAFAKEYFDGQDPVGKSFARGKEHLDIVGFVRDARYRNMREPITATAYVPLRVAASGEALSRATFLVRTAASNPLALASMLRREVPRARSEFRVSNIRTQEEIDRSQTVRERLLAMLALFFAVVALLLAGIGLYGVLDYSVFQRRREIGIRMAIGAQAGAVARLVTVDVFSMVLLGAFAGVALGLASARYLETLLYEVKATDVGMLALPALMILAAALLAALPAVIRAVRIDPATTLRAE